MSNSNLLRPKDNQWLQVDICSEFLVRNCTNASCNYAHPSASVEIVDGKVVTCFDSLRDKCRRSSCKFFHPTSHLVDLLFSKTKQSVKVKAASSSSSTTNMPFVPIDKYPQAMQYPATIQIAPINLIETSSEVPIRIDKRCADTPIDAIAESFYPSLFLKRVPFAQMPYSCFPNFMPIPSSSTDIIPAMPAPAPVTANESECSAID